VKNSRASNGVAWLVALTAIAVGVEVSAHRQDELLQAARLAIEPAGVNIELDLTPGMAIADAMVEEIDRDRDGAWSAAEQQGYSSRVLSALDVFIDETPMTMQLGAWTFPDAQAMRRGEGRIRLQATAPLAAQAIGAHRLRFRNRHDPARSVYLANALVPSSDAVAVTGQVRDGAQSELTIEYSVRERPAVFPAVWALAGGVTAAVLIATRRWRRESVSGTRLKEVTERRR
jgi:hypothetical protein